MTANFPRTMGYGLGASLQRGTSAFGPWVTSDPYDYPLRDQTMTSAPYFPPFKFESRRARIDWRLLHGIDINAMMRDVDLDTLEKIVNIVAFGDIEAEDTRHLTELNFIKIFRLSQMMIEYLLYVQDCLQSSNTWLQQDRSNMDKYIQAARLRLRELDANLKMTKRELKRSRKTIRTYELLAVLNDGSKGAGPNAATTMPVSGTTTNFAAAVPPPAPVPPPSQPQVTKAEPNPMNLALEALLRKELAVLGERLSKATLECQTLRSERDELYLAVKDLETAVKARPQTSGTSSPLAISRQNAEALQTIQGFQDQLNKATAEITKLRNEKEDLSEELDRANTERRQLQDEKSRLLSELATRPDESAKGATESPRVSGNLSVMLLDAERQKAGLQDQLSDAKAEITALQRQLMKFMKDTALGALPSQPSDDRLLRELESAKAQLEKELTEMRRLYNEDVRQLQEELEAAQVKAVDADRRLSELRAAASTQVEGSPLSSSPSPPRTGGFIKIPEERSASPEPVDDGYSTDKQRALLAEYEATNDRLNQQLLQLKSERSALAGEVEQLRLQLQNRPSPPQGDRSIHRDWRTEEIERLEDQRDAAQRRLLDLEDTLHDRDALIERLRATIRDLQAQLEERAPQLATPGSEPSIVKQQVKHFERLAEYPAKPPKVQSSFSFAGSAGISEETPTSVRKPAISEATPSSPERSPSPEMPVVPEEPTEAAAELVPPSPKHPSAHMQGEASPQAARWLRRIPWPSQAAAAAIHQEKLRLVAGLSPEALDMRVQDEIRVITENPYEYESDDEERFRAMMPHEMAERKGVRSVSPHDLEDLATARTMYTDQLLAVVDDELAQFGIDPSASTLSDKAYLACMQMLESRRSRMLQRYPKEVQDRAEDLHNLLLTHIELVKRGFEADYRLKQQAELQQQLQEQKLQSQKVQRQSLARQSGAAASRSGAGEDENPTGVAATATTATTAPMAVSGATDKLSRASVEEMARSVTLSPGQGLGAATEAAAKQLALTSTGAAAAGLATPASVPASPAQRQLPSFPSRQMSQRSSNATGGGETNTGMEELRNMLPPAAGSSRPTSGAMQQPVASQMDSLSTRGRGATGTGTGGSGDGRGSNTHLSREGSGIEIRRAKTATHDDDISRKMQRASSAGSTERAADSRPLSVHSQRSTQRSGTFAQAKSNTTPSTSITAMAGAAGAISGSKGPTQGLLKQETSPGSPDRIVLGHAKPVPRPGAAAVAAVATVPGGNMNMSIRSVKYQDSDFDDDSEDAMPIPQPKPVRRLAEEDEYTLTEDEEAQQDMGIEDSEDFSSGAQQPKILMAPGGSSPRNRGPSRLGTQPTPATIQTRGWATEEPLQPAPVKAKSSLQASETAEVEMLDSIQSFDNPSNSHSIKRSPGAWGSPNTTLRKAVAHGTKEPSTQVSVASRQSGWNEAIASFGTASGVVDEVQAIQDITESSESVRPIGRFVGQRGPVSMSQPTAPQPRTIHRRGSFSSEISDIEYV